MELIDLSLSMNPGMRGVDVKPAYTLAEDGWNATTWQLYSHACTHADSPYHFEASDTRINQMPLDVFCGPARVARMPGVEPRQWLKPSDLGESGQGVQPGECLLLHTGWSRHVDDAAIYRDGLPRVSDELANWLVKRQVKLIGVEAPSVADVNDLAEVTRIHRILLSAGITIVEGLCNLDKISDRTYFMAFPLKLSGSDGSPVRAVAMEGLPLGVV